MSPRTAYDAIVVGSGFGGGVMACRLAEAGVRVCVLERGRRFGREDFISRPEQAPQLLWHRSANPGGMFDVRLMHDLVVITAAGVGGGSLVYANVQLPAPPAVFAQGWPDGTTRASLERWYRKTEEALDPRPTPDDPPLAKIRAFEAAGVLAGRQPRRLPIAVHFGEPRLHPFSGVAQEGCQNLGRCDIGCPVHAKNTVDITYLARAEARGAQVLPLHEARRIDRDAAGWSVGARDLGAGRNVTVRAPLLILSAGVLGSTRLLLAARRRIGGLSPALGTRFSGNGDALGAAFDPTAPGVTGASNHIGPTMTTGLDYLDERRLMLADGGLPDGFGGLLDVPRGLNVIKGWRRWLLGLRFLLARAGYTDASMRPRELRLRRRSSNADALVFLMFGRDAADGEIRLTRLLRRLDVSWSKAGSAQLFADLERTALELAAAAGATPFYALDGGPLGRFMTVHPLGGCPMADDPAKGVVDAFGKVHGHEGLYVADGAIVPTSLGVNPSKTIAALAERAAAQLTGAP